MKKKIIIFTILSIILFSSSLIIVNILFSIFRTKGIINATIFFAGLKMRKVWLLSLTLFGVFFGFMLWTLIKSIKNDSFNKIERSKAKVYGDAEFMSAKEEKKKYGNGKDYHKSNNLIAYKGGYVFNSFTRSKILNFSAINKQNGLVIGTSGTGKSMYFLNPTIQMIAKSYDKPSIIVNDLKGELNEANSLVLQKNGYQVIVLDLRNPRKGVRYNPLGFIYDLYHEYINTNNMDLFDMVYSYIKDFAKVLIPTPDGSDATWSEGAQDIVIGLIFAMLEDSLKPEYCMTKNKFTITQLSNILNVQKSEMIPYLSQREKTSKVFHHAGFILDNSSEKTVDSYISTVQTGISKFMDSGIEYITSDTDFDLSKINETPTAIFLVIPDENKARYRLANLYVTQLYNYLTLLASKRENKSLERTTYFLLDEFGNMPKLPFINEWVSLCRGRNIFFLIILQAISQLESLYTPQVAKTILQNLHFQCFLGANEVSSLEYFQKLLGTYTILGKSKSLDSRLAEKGESSGSMSHSKKHLVEQDELQYIQPGNSYVVINREKPLKTKLVPFFDKKMQQENVFIKGSINYEKDEIKINPLDVFFDLKKRNNIYNGVVEIEEIKEYDDEYLNEYIKMQDEYFEEIEEHRMNVQYYGFKQVKKIKGVKK